MRWKIFVRFMTLICPGLLVCAPMAAVEVGIIVYESKGAETRVSRAGHIALITTTLCPDGTAGLRRCNPGERPGAVITSYANVASGYGQAIFAVPVQVHFTATIETVDVPVLSNDISLRNMQLEYWRRSLQTSLPPISATQYRELREAQTRFSAGRIFRRTITLEYLFRLLGPRGKKSSTEPIAIVDPLTQELIPEGRWRDAIGVQYARSSVIILARTSPEQEERLLDYIGRHSHDEFNAISNNCSDFVARALAVVFEDAGFHRRPRLLNAANAWVSSPLDVATNFLSFAKRRRVALDVQFMPMIASTRRASFPGRSISRGILVPDTSQGKLGFGVRLYFNFLNPLLGLTAFGVDRASRFADLRKLIHQRGSPELSRMANDSVIDPALLPRARLTIKQEQIEVFGSVSCWEAKKSQFASLEGQAEELGVISPLERSWLLRKGESFQLARFYERTFKAPDSNVMLAAETRTGSGPGGGDSMILPSFPGNVARSSSAGNLFDGIVPDRARIQAMVDSGSSREAVTAFRLMTTVINYGLSSEATARGTARSFDSDWRLYLKVAQANSLLVPEAGPLREDVHTCSVREFQAGIVKTDAWEESQSAKHRLGRELRGLIDAPAR